MGLRNFYQPAVTMKMDIIIIIFPIQSLNPRRTRTDSVQSTMILGHYWNLLVNPIPTVEGSVMNLKIRNEPPLVVKRMLGRIIVLFKFGVRSHLCCRFTHLSCSTMFWRFFLRLSVNLNGWPSWSATCQTTTAETMQLILHCQWNVEKVILRA